MAAPQIAEETRKEIFFEVVTAEDAGAEPKVARQQVAERFGVTVESVREIEDEGIEFCWPPLEPCDEDEEDE